MDLTTIETILKETLDSDPSFKTLILVSVDGLPLSSASRMELDEEKLAAVSSLAISTIEKVSKDMEIGGLKDTIVRGEDGVVFIYNLNNEGVLVALADKSVKLGLALYQLKNASNLVLNILTASGSSASAGELA